MQTDYTFRSMVQSYSTRFFLTSFLLITFFLSGFVSFSQTTVNIPDANFRAKLVQVSGISAGSDTNVIVDDISAVTSLEVQGNSSTPESEKITDLTGIEAFTSLTILNCGFNLLTSLDISKNVALTDLRCYRNQLTGLDISKNTALTILYTATNPSLGNLDVSKNTTLTGLRCIDNGLTSLNVSTNTDLTELLCHINQLTSLNAKNGNNNSLVTFNATDNPSLTCIQVDDASSSIPSGWTKDDATMYSENCATAGNEDFERADISIWPNPTNDIINISADEKADYKLLNIRGQVLIEGTLETTGKKIDVSSLSKGIYLLNLKTSKGSFTEKVVRK